MPVQRRRSGFSLVEILVVIGVVALLLAVLLPVLSGVRASARTAACLSNHKSIAEALMLRTNDHDGFAQLAGLIELPEHLGPTSDLPMALGDGDRHRYEYARTNALGTTQFRDRLVAPDAAMRDYLGDLDAAFGSDIASPWQCPEAWSPLLGDQVQAYVIDGKGLVLSDPRRIDLAHNETVFGFSPTSNPRRLRGQLARIRDPSRLTLLGDAEHEPHTLTFTWAADFDDGDAEEYAPGPVTMAALLAGDGDPSLRPSRRLTTRHRGGANYLLADGHAVTLATEADALEALLLAFE